ncbi:penicillin-binding protein 2 [Pararhodobacter sp. CCB-MM2]|uniref:peptidoglycan D,D-transpeptidase FtsI family protein n=1 Tax=Pararhodobacter sp. CCB-MM2 TaxID=1786003 RepID=UPI00082CA3E6|nr:penicillin-binding protein 2 [Pararhodobacter sp. CCB-MM2]MCA2010071.1 penicillin-binding protein 2 [Cereibacter sphaeroides]
MIRTPLRPLARILDAREQGVNPQSIERENLRLRREQARDAGRRRAEWRLLFLAVAFFAGYAAIGAKMGMLAASPVVESEPYAGEGISGARADVLDRNGRILATNLVTHSLYAEMRYMIDGARAAHELVQIFPDLEEESLSQRLTDPRRRFTWIRSRVSPEQAQATHDIGEPGLLLGPRDMRLYPNGELAAHLMGGTSYGEQGVTAAEIQGVAGLEYTLNERLSDADLADVPLSLALDLPVQAVVEEVLADGLQMYNANGGSVILMDAHTGELVAMASAPTFDPNNRPAPALTGDPADSPLFNRAVQGLYELGSVMKVFAVAQALELGLVTPDTMMDTQGPIRFGRFRISDMHSMPSRMSVTDVLIESSNVGTARLAQMIGAPQQRSFLQSLGLLDYLPIELPESTRVRPQYDERWSEISMMTISYGHGLSITPLHLAAAYAAMVNGGTMVQPTLLRRPDAPVGRRVISEQTSLQLRRMLRSVVTEGTASFGEVEGYFVGGKTGTADKPNPQGGYYEDRTVATFAGAFPMNDPRYVFVVTMDEPTIFAAGENRRTAGWTVVPVVAQMVRRVAPMLGLRPQDAADVDAELGLR